METMTIKEFYEGFNEFDSFNESVTEHKFFQAESNSKASHQLHNIPTVPSEKPSLNLEDSDYLDTSPQYNSNQLIQDQIGDRDQVFPYCKNASFLPACQLVENNQVFANPYTAITNRNNTINNTLKNSNDRLANVFKHTENINCLPNGPFLSGPRFINKNVAPKASSSKASSNQNGQFNNNFYNFKNMDFIWHGQPSNGVNTFPIHEYNKPIIQRSTDNQRNYYDSLENTSKVNSFENTNSLLYCQPSTSRQPHASHYDSFNNISINIGNSISQPLQNQIFSNQYIGGFGYCGASDNQYLVNATNLINHNGEVHNSIIGKNYTFEPKTTLNQYKYGSNHQKNIDFICDKDSQETINPYEQVIDISKTIGNLPFQEFSNLNGPLKENMNNSSFNINNIKTINVHFHHPTKFSSPGNEFQQSHLIVEPSPIGKKNYDLLQNEQNTISPSTIQHGDKYVSRPSWMPMDVDLSDVYCPIDSQPRNIIRDDIYLPASEESYQSNDLDDWLDTIKVTPLEPYMEQSFELYLGSESTSSQVNNVLSVASKPKSKRKRARSKIGKDAVDILKKWYGKEPYPNYIQQQQISEETGHSVDTVRVWFQNRRQILKRRHLMDTSNKENTIV